MDPLDSYKNIDDVNTGSRPTFNQRIRRLRPLTRNQRLGVAAGGSLGVLLTVGLLFQPPAESGPVASFVPFVVTKTVPNTGTSTYTTTSPVAIAPEEEELQRLRVWLSELSVVQELSTEVPYERDTYLPGGWNDPDGDCRSVRHDVLLAEGENVGLTEDACYVTSGRWVDAWTGQVIDSIDNATIDHLVPLAHAHKAGGWEWAESTRQAFANDLAGLNVVSQQTNSGKGSSVPPNWIPSFPNQCRYAAAWTRLKTKWRLAVTSAEVGALRALLDTCTEETSSGLNPKKLGDPLPRPTITKSAPTTTTTTRPEIVEGGGLVVVSCSRRSETATIANQSPESQNVSGWLLHDEGINHSTRLPSVVVDPGGILVVESGPEAGSGDGLRWTEEHVWNNDGDVAFLVPPQGLDFVSSSVRCS